VKKRLLLFVGILVSGLFGQAPNERIVVIVLLHSGLPNPTFDINQPQDIADLKALSRDLPPAGETTVPFGGFQLANEGVPEFPEEVLVCRGLIRTFQGGTTAYFKDARGLEQWLGTKARQRGINPDGHK
jgi:hypothetical protein